MSDVAVAAVREELHVEIDGEGDPVVIVNGLFQSTDSWRGYVPSLSRYLRLIRYDQRNQGKSPCSLDVSLEVHVEDLRRLLDRLELPQAGFVGHSFGCRLLMEFAERYPERVSGVVLVSGNTPQLAPRYQLLFDNWRAILERSDPEAREFVDALIPWIYSARFPLEHQGLMRLLYRQFATRERAPLLANLAAAIDAYSPERYRSQRKAVEAPVCVLQGDHDYITPPSELGPLLKGLKRGRLEVLPGGHALALEAEPLVGFHVLEQFQ